MGLFTYDINLDKVADAIYIKKPTDGTIEEYTTFSRENFEREWDRHPDIINTWAVNEAFLERFHEGFNAYITGKWHQAKVFLY